MKILWIKLTNIKLKKWLVSKELDKNVVLETINQMKTKIQTWKSLINPGKLMNDQDKLDLTGYDTNSLAKTIHYLIYSDIKFEYNQGNSNLGLGYIFETNNLLVNESNSLIFISKKILNSFFLEKFN
jgi:hypothetical protein